MLKCSKKITIYTMVLLAAHSHAQEQTDYFDLMRNGEGDYNKNISSVNNPEIEKSVPIGDDGNPLSVREQAFKEIVRDSFPLKPEQITEYRRLVEEEQAAMHAPAKAPPNPISSTMTVDLSPGVVPPVIRLAIGFVSSIMFVDSTGKPWPMIEYSLGYPEAFHVQWEAKTNTFFMQGKKDYITTNLAVKLANLETPIILSLVSGQKDVDIRLDIQIPERGPNAIAPMVESIAPQANNSHLLTVLDGIAPPGSTELKVSGNYGRAWIHNDRLLFRSQQQVLSPAWAAIVTSADGTKAYEMLQTPMILISDNGRPVKVYLSGM